MRYLTLIHKGEELATYPIHVDLLRIGRNQDNDIRIDNLAVSGHHAQITTNGSSAIIEDCNSTNGTYINGTRIKNHTLADGDIVGIGNYRLAYSTTGEPDPPEHPDLDAAQSRKHAEVVCPGETALPPSALDRRALSGPRGATSKPKQLRRRAYLTVLNSGIQPRQLDLDKRFTTLGTTRNQIAVVQRDTGYYVVPVETSPGAHPRVNGQPVGPTATPLGMNDIVEVAGVRMAFKVGEDCSESC